VQALNLMSVINPRIRHVAIDGAFFQQEVAEREVMAVPTVLMNGQPFGQGRMGLEEILAKIDTGAAAVAADKLRAKEAFDVLVVGGGPAGAAAAIYAARKGILTGIILGVARISGETAPLLFTSGDNQYWSTGLNQPAASLPVSCPGPAPILPLTAQPYPYASVPILQVLVRLGERLATLEPFSHGGQEIAQTFRVERLQHVVVEIVG